MKELLEDILERIGSPNRFMTKGEAALIRELGEVFTKYNVQDVADLKSNLEDAWKYQDLSK